MYDISIPEEPPILLPPPEPLSSSLIPLTTITTKWEDNYQEWGECNPTCCSRCYLTWLLRNYY